MTFSEKVAAAKAARPYKDQPIILDRAISEEQERLEAELQTADTDSRLAAKSPAEEIQERLDDLAAEAASSTETIRVYRMPGRDWVNLTSKCPVRPDVAIDAIYGYNVDMVIEASLRYRDPSTNATYAFRLEDGQPVEVTDDEWTDLFSIISGREYALLRDAVYVLNEYEPQQRLHELVKGSGAASRSANK
jgi:hypothetical protein